MIKGFSEETYPTDFLKDKCLPAKLNQIIKT